MRDALLVDALGTARQLPDLLAAADAVHETFRDVLRRLRDPLWKAVALSLLVPLSAVAPGRTPATIVAELVPLLRQIGADASQRDELGRQLPALVERVAPHGEAALVQVFQQLPDPTLRAFGLTHLLEARSAPATPYPRS
ncbi:MAG: hypothetical protein U1F43_05260 [Myxococcota bacterium]